MIHHIDIISDSSICACSYEFIIFLGIENRNITTVNENRYMEKLLVQTEIIFDLKNYH